MILLDAVENNRPITGELLEIAMAVAGDNIIATTLKEGHKEYVSMPKKAPNGIMNKVLVRLEGLEASSGNANNSNIQLDHLNGRVDDIEELVISPDKSRQDEILEGIIFRFNEKREKKIYTPPYKQ